MPAMEFRCRWSAAGLNLAHNRNTSDSGYRRVGIPRTTRAAVINP